MLIRFLGFLGLAAAGVGSGWVYASLTGLDPMMCMIAAIVITAIYSFVVSKTLDKTEAFGMLTLLVFIVMIPLIWIASATMRPGWQFGERFFFSLIFGFVMMYIWSLTVGPVSVLFWEGD